MADHNGIKFLKVRRFVILRTKQSKLKLLWPPAERNDGYSRSFVSFKIIFFYFIFSYMYNPNNNIFSDLILYLIIITYSSDDGIMGNCSFLKHSTWIIEKNNINKMKRIFYNILPREQIMAWYFTSQLFWCFVYWINNRQFSSVYLHGKREHRFICYVTRYIVRGR